MIRALAILLGIAACAEPEAPRMHPDAGGADAMVVDAAPTDAADDAPLDDLVREPLVTRVSTIEGCETWPAMPGPGIYLPPRRLPDRLLFPGFTSDGSLVRSRIFEYDGADWRLALEVEHGPAPYPVVELVTFGAQALFSTPGAVYARAGDGSWGVTAGTAGQPQMHLVAHRDQAYGWRREDKRRLYRWDAALGWQYVFGTQYGVNSVVVGDRGIFVNVPSGAIRQWNEAELALFPPPTTTESWDVFGDASGSLFAAEMDTTDLRRFMRLDAAGWTDLGYLPPIWYPIAAPGGALMAGPNVLLGEAWIALPPVDADAVTAFPEGGAVAVASTQASDGPRPVVPYELVDGVWRELPHPVGIEGDTLFAVDAALAWVTAFGSLFALDGSTWTRIEVPFLPAKNAVAAGEHLFVAGARSGRLMVAHWDGALWTLDDVGVPGSATWSTIEMSARRPDDVYLTANCSLFRFDGAAWARIFGDPCEGFSVSDATIAFAGDDDVVYRRTETGSSGSVVLVDHWPGPGQEWIPLEPRTDTLVGQLRDSAGVLRVAMIVGSSDGQLLILDDAGWSAPRPVAGLWGDALSGTSPNDVIVAAGDRFLRWNGASIESDLVSVPLGTRLWSDGVTALSSGIAGTSVARCALSF